MAQVIDTETVNNFTINKVPTQAVFDSMLANDQVKDNELYIVEGDYVPEPATATPLVENASGAVGNSDKYAREDHVHPARVIDSSEVTDDSSAGGATVKASLEVLDEYLSSLRGRYRVTALGSLADFITTVTATENGAVGEISATSNLTTALHGTGGGNSIVLYKNVKTTNRIVYVCIEQNNIVCGFINATNSTVYEGASLKSRILRVTGTISSSQLYVADANVITAMVPISCEFGTPSNVLSNYTINTDTAGRITFTGITLAGSTTVDVILGIPNS